MSTDNCRQNMLYEMAQALADSGQQTAAIGLRRLALAGYTTLQQVDAASDWALLSIPGIGLGRLTAVRKLTTPGWRRPSTQAIKDMTWFLSALRLALHFWAIGILASLVRGSEPPSTAGFPAEARLALDVWGLAVRRALHHCDPRTVVQIMSEVAGGQPSVSPPGVPPFEDSGGQEVAPGNLHLERSACHAPAWETARRGMDEENDHYAFPRHERLEIVRLYRAAREAGKVRSKHGWAQANYQISGKTLLAYEREFAEAEP